MFGQVTALFGLALAPGERTIVERPPPGFGRGLYQTDAPLVVLATAVLVLTVVATYLVVWRKKRGR